VSVISDELSAVRQVEPRVSSDAVAQLESRLQRAENNLIAGDVMRDNLRSDREKVTYFLNYSHFLLWHCQRREHVV